ncbi:MAG: pyruvate, water dikinase [Deltaproteobacteria bacterium]|nr:pyruvate, water dikinase [Deltaproteobacteria bacterium]
MPLTDSGVVQGNIKSIYSGAVAKMVRFIRDMLAGLRTQKDPSGVRKTDEELQRGFKLRYLQFKRILNANEKVLNMIAEMEEALRGEKPFGMSFIRSRCTLISANVLQIIQHLSALAPEGQYQALDERFNELQQKIGSLLDTRPKTSKGPSILDLKEIDKTMIEAAGAKMASLGEIRNRLKLNTPPGFVISADAYNQFMAYNRLQEEIDRRIQTHNTGDLDHLYELSSDLQQLVIQSPMPESLETEIFSAVDSMWVFSENVPSLAVRSSAVNEDIRESSFAGQYRSILNVSPNHLIQAYKEVIAGKYTATAMSYRFHRGLRDEDVIMCVGCLKMVNTVCGGVAYTRNPLNPSEETILINAVWGLPGLVVDGRSSVDRFVLSRSEPFNLLAKDIARKTLKYQCLNEEGICRYTLNNSESTQPSLSDEQVFELGRLVLKLDTHFGEPQDIEWSIDFQGRIVILQCRPLQMAPLRKSEPELIESKDIEGPVLLQGGVAASPGTASGPVYILRREADKLQFKSGSVMVISQSLPGYATLLNRAAAVVAEYGSQSSHLANVAREYGVPALFGVNRALDELHSGQVVTVDSQSRRIYDGSIKNLNNTSGKPRQFMVGTPVYQTLKDVSAYIIPLTLLDTDSADFRPGSCRSFHDIIRYCHESAVRNMFRFGRENEFPQRSSKQLLVDVPMKWWVLNLDDGFGVEVEGLHIKLDNIVSIPMLALWEGITMVPWEGPPPLDGKGFLSVMFEATRNTALLPGVQSHYGERNYFMIAKNYCSLTSRFGFHFATVESYVSERVPENYIIFRFKGGAADDYRKHRRVNLIAEILEDQDFSVSVNEDVLTARFEDYPMDVMRNRLKILGYIIMHTRQLDMVMSNDAMVMHYRNKIMTGIAGLFRHDRPEG